MIENWQLGFLLSNLGFLIFKTHFIKLGGGWLGRQSSS
jgi:hypothetical protein